MDKKVFELVAKFLSDYSEVLGRNSCNDWSFPDDWTLEEKQEFVSKMYLQNGDPENYNPSSLHVPDFWVASFLSFVILEISKMSDINE